MKFYQTHFEEYINECQTNNLHLNLEKIYDKFPQTIQQFKNVMTHQRSMKCVSGVEISKMSLQLNFIRPVKIA